MLANLVRIRYFQSPIFLQVSSLNTSFAVGGNVESLGHSRLGWVGSSWSQRLVVHTRSVRPSRSRWWSLGNTTGACWHHSALIRSHRSCWAGSTASSCSEHPYGGINGLQNLNADFDRSSEEPLAHARFEEVLELIKKLRSKGIVDLELGGKQTSWSSPVVQWTRQAIFRRSSCLELPVTRCRMMRKLSVTRTGNGRRTGLKSTWLCGSRRRQVTRRMPTG